MEERGAARALELQLGPPASGGEHLAERDGAPVAQLPRPVSELVPAVACGIWSHTEGQVISAT
jgi:hypothetical protein